MLWTILPIQHRWGWACNYDKADGENTPGEGCICCMSACVCKQKIQILRFQAKFHIDSTNNIN
jgi:hypothetical protein